MFLKFCSIPYFCLKTIFRLNIFPKIIIKCILILLANYEHLDKFKIGVNYHFFITGVNGSDLHMTLWYSIVWDGKQEVNCSLSR